MMGSSVSYFEPTGLAAARMDVRALRVVMIPAFAMETVCCSYTEGNVSIGNDEGEERNGWGSVPLLRGGHFV